MKTNFILKILVVNKNLSLYSATSFQADRVQRVIFAIEHQRLKSFFLGLKEQEAASTFSKSSSDNVLQSFSTKS